MEKEEVGKSPRQRAPDLPAGKVLNVVTLALKSTTTDEENQHDGSSEPSDE